MMCRYFLQKTIAIHMTYMGGYFFYRYSFVIPLLINAQRALRESSELLIGCYLLVHCNYQKCMKIF